MTRFARTLACLLLLCQCARAERPPLGEQDSNTATPATQKAGAALRIGSFPYFGAFMDIQAVRAGAYTLVFFFDDDSPDKVPFVLAVRHDGNLALEQPLDTSRLLPLTIRSERGAITVELIDPHPAAGKAPSPSAIQFSVHGTASDIPVTFALAQGAVFTVGLDDTPETIHVRQLPVAVFNDDLMPKDDTREAVSHSRNAIASWWHDILRREVGPTKQTTRNIDEGASEVKHEPVSAPQQDTSSVDRTKPSAPVHDNVAVKCKFIESAGVHQTHPLIDLRGPFIVRSRGYSLVFPATFASDVDWLPEGIPFIVAVKCPMSCRIVSTVTRAANNSPAMVEMSGWVALENRGQIDLDYTVEDQRGSYSADGTPLVGNNAEEMSFCLGREPWIDFDLAKGRVFLVTIDEDGSAHVRQLESVTIPQSVLGADDGRKSEEGVARVVDWLLTVNLDLSEVKPDSPMK